MSDTSIVFTTFSLKKIQILPFYYNCNNVALMLEFISMDNGSKQLLGKILKDNGYSFTNARKLIIEKLWDVEPQSTHDLIKSLDDKIDRASLYRNITLFEKLGLIQRVYIGWKYKVELSDIFSSHHHHISCLDCGKIKAIHEETEIETFIHRLSNTYGITAERHQLEIQGYCSDCRNKSTE
jgi:Fe2+ or Zn2+ uptake regulation protein